jgi:hypothetical protein
VSTELCQAHMMPEGTPEIVLRLMSGPIGEAIAEAVAYSDASFAPATRRAYQRDWALLLIGFAGGLRRSGLVALEVADL